jgi:hypothetical protein
LGACGRWSRTAIPVRDVFVESPKGEIGVGFGSQQLSGMCTLCSPRCARAKPRTFGVWAETRNKGNLGDRGKDGFF